MPFMRCIGSWSLHQTVTRAIGDDARSRISTGMKVAGPMMLRPVEFDAAGDPRAGQPDERRLDHILPIEEVIAVGLVEPNVNAPADLRQNHQAQIRVLNVHRLPRLLDCCLVQCDR